MSSSSSNHGGCNTEDADFMLKMIVYVLPAINNLLSRHHICAVANRFNDITFACFPGSSDSRSLSYISAVPILFVANKSSKDSFILFKTV